MKRVVARALIALAVAGLIASPFAFGVTVTPGSNSPGIAGTPSLDKTTGQVKCVQTPGVTVTLPGSSATAWNACASVTTTYSDYCSNTANGIPCLDSNTKISTSVVPDLSGTYVAGSGTLSGTTYYVPVKTASGWGDSRITDNAASGTTTLAGGTAPGGYPPLLKLTGLAYTGIDLTGTIGGYAFSIANNQFFRMANTSGAQQNILGVSSDNVTYLGANSGNSIRIATPLGYGNTNGITVSPTTNYVGIGKTPSDLLDVAGAVGALSLKLNGATSGAVTHGVAATTASYSMLDPATAPAAGQAVVYPAGGGQGTWVTPATLDGTTKVPIAQLPVGTTAGTVAAGNDSRFASTTGANSSLSNLTSPTAINQDLLPFYNNLNVGSSTAPWNNIYGNELRIGPIVGGYYGVRLTVDGGGTFGFHAVRLGPDGIVTSGTIEGSNLTPYGHALIDVQKPSSNGTPGYVLETVDGTSTNTQWVANGSGAGIGCSGTCSASHLAAITDATHITNGPTYSATPGAGVAALGNSNGKLDAWVSGRMLNTDYTYTTSDITSDYGYTWSTVLNITTANTAAASLIIDAGAAASLNGATYCSIQLTVDSTVLPPIANTTVSSGRTQLALFGTYAVTPGGTHTVYLKIQANEGGRCVVAAYTGNLRVQEFN